MVGAANRGADAEVVAAGSEAVAEAILDAEADVEVDAAEGVVVDAETRRMKILAFGLIFISALLLFFAAIAERDGKVTVRTSFRSLPKSYDRDRDPEEFRRVMMYVWLRAATPGIVGIFLLGMRRRQDRLDPFSRHFQGRESLDELADHLDREEKSREEDYAQVGWYHVTELRRLFPALEAAGVRFFFDAPEAGLKHADPGTASHGTFGQGAQVLVWVHGEDQGTYERVYVETFESDDEEEPDWKENLRGG